MSPLQVTYRRNPSYVEGDLQRPRLWATIDLRRYGVEVEISDLPVYFRPLSRPVGPILQVYSTSVAGLPLEKGNLNSLEKTLDLYLGALIHFGRLPEYVFQVGANAWPIYRLSDQLVTRYPGSPVFSAPTIGELRMALADDFKSVGQIRNRKELGILALSRYNLQLYPPICTLRVQGMADVPVFPLFDGGEPQLTAPVNATSITVPLAAGKGILDLYWEVDAYLRQRGRLTDAEQMSVRKLSAATWAGMRDALRPYQRCLAYHIQEKGRLVRQQIPVYQNGRTLIAARTNRLGRTALYLAPDIRKLQSSLGQELYARGKLPSPSNLAIGKVTPDTQDDDAQTSEFRTVSFQRTSTSIF